MPRDLRARTLAYLRSGAVRIYRAEPPRGMGPVPPEYVEALVVGFKSDYRVRLERGRWVCSCQEAQCPHIASVQMCTGHDSAVRPPKTTTVHGRA
ncbi:hypothetical protein [Streptosporangium sp. NPDC002607]